MGKTMLAGLFACMVAIGVPAAAQTADTRDARTIDDIQNALLRLPYYGVFDSIAFSYERGTVTLMGFAAHTTLRSDAERAVKRVPRVDEVVNKIEELPMSPMDDDLRWRIFYNIYNDPFLSRYAPGGGMMWGHRHPIVGSPFGVRSRFPGMYPTGNYPIQIIVRRGQVTLMGVVDNDADKTMAGARAREVSGSFGVENELEVEKR